MPDPLPSVPLAGQPENTVRSIGRKALCWVLRGIAGLLAFIAAYLLAAVALPLVPMNADFTECEGDCVEVYLFSNGVHLDIVLPLRNEHMDWTTRIDPGKTRSGSTRARYAAFGWGDKGFYLDTPTWAELKASTAFVATFYLGSTAMHVTFHEALREGPLCRRVHISPSAYRRIVDRIMQDFSADASGQFQLVQGASYGHNDLFYEAEGTYGMFHTCNTWTNSVLKAGGMRACLWTAFDKGILYQYREGGPLRGRR